MTERFAMVKSAKSTTERFAMVKSATHAFTGVTNAEAIASRVGCGLLPEDILLEQLTGDVLDVPRHFVAPDRNQQTIVIAIRGTSAYSDLIVDAQCQSEEFASGVAHFDIKESALGLQAAITPTLIDALVKHPSFSATVTGHSLGAGAAILLTKLLLDDSAFTGVKITCYAFAPPPVFGPLDAVDEAWSSSLICFVNADDVVPRTSLRAMRALALEVEHVDSLPSDVLVNPTSGAAREVIEDNPMLFAHKEVERANTSIDDDGLTQPITPSDTELSIPAVKGVHWLVPRVEDDIEGNSSPMLSDIAAPYKFSRIFVTKTAASSHLLDSYARAFGCDLQQIPGAPAKKFQPIPVESEKEEAQVPADATVDELQLSEQPKEESKPILTEPAKVELQPIPANPANEELQPTLAALETKYLF
jgi:Lipase (class 3)